MNLLFRGDEDADADAPPPICHGSFSSKDSENLVWIHGIVDSIK